MAAILLHSMPALHARLANREKPAQPVPRQAFLLSFRNHGAPLRPACGSDHHTAGRRSLSVHVEPSSLVLSQEVATNAAAPHPGFITGTVLNSVVFAAGYKVSGHMVGN
jgi:hypothetical protein